MKNMKLRKIICLLLVTCSSCSFFAGCTDDINNYEKQTAAEASNKVFISDKYASLAFNAQRTVEGKVANMDTLVALSTSIAFLFSFFNTVYPQFWYEKGLEPHVYYEASGVIIAFVVYRFIR